MCCQDVERSVLNQRNKLSVSLGPHCTDNIESVNSLALLGLCFGDSQTDLVDPGTGVADVEVWEVGIIEP